MAQSGRPARSEATTQRSLDQQRYETVEDVFDNLVRLAKTDPTAAVGAAASSLDDLDASIAARARWATGRARYELAENGEAILMLRSARGIAPNVGLRQRIETSLAAALGASGETDSARALLASIETDPADELVSALASSQTALLDLGGGDITQARERLRIAIPVLLAEPAALDAAARALGNLGNCEMVLGDLSEASDHYEHAIRLGHQHGEAIVAIGCQQNLGYVAMLRGEYPRALAALDDARAAYEAIDAPSRNFSTLFHDLAEVRRLAGLGPESVEAARIALDIVLDGGNTERIAEARYQLGLCLLDDGRSVEAREVAMLADQEFRAASRTLWSQRCALIELEAVIADPNPDPETLERAAGSIRDLVDRGWTSLAVRISNGVAFAAWKAGDVDAARHLQAIPEPDDHRPILDVLEVAFRDALSAASGGRDPIAALRRGRRLVAEHASRLRDPELRARANRLGERFRQLGLRYAIEHSDPLAALDVEEMWRRSSAAPARLSVPADPDVAAASEALRRYAVDHPDHAVSVEESTEIHRLEKELRQRSRRSTHDLAVGPLDMQFDHAALVARLGDRRFIELIEVGEELWAVEVTVGTATLRRIGPVTSFIGESEQLRQRLGRLLRPGLSDRRLEARWSQLLVDAQRFARRLGVDRNEGDVVLAPTAALRAVPWGLVMMNASAVTIAPDATSWVHVDDPLELTDVGVLVGPRLEHGDGDVNALTQQFADATVRTGAAATSGALRELAGGSQLLHIAAHGEFRGENAWFSALELADGPFTLYDLEQLEAPALVTLAACDTGRTAIDGAELTGAAPAWLHAGSRRVLAPICAVPDLAASRFAARYYAALLGSVPEHALREALIHSLDAPVVERATAAAFVTYGGHMTSVSSRVHAASV